MKERILSLMLAVMMAFGCTACGTEKASTKKSTKITFWSGDGALKNTLEKIVDEYNNGQGKEKGIIVELTVNGAENAQSIDIAKQNGQLPDICSPTYSQSELFAKQGDIVPLEKFKGGKELIEKTNTPKVEKRNMYDGKVYGCFTEVSTAGLIYNKDLFKKAGIVDEKGEAKPPKTWDELRDAAKKITDVSKNIYGYSFPFDFSTYYSLEAPYATSIDRNTTDYDELTVKPSNYADVFDFILTLKKDGSLFPGADTLDNDTSRAYFAEGNIGMMTGISWDTGVLTTQFVAKCDWGVAPTPVKDPNVTYPAWSSQGGLKFLTKTALKHPDEAFDFYKYLLSDDVLLRLCEENGLLPFNEEIFNKAKNVDEHARQFRALYDDKFDRTVYPTYTVEGDTAKDLYQKVWAGKMTPYEAEEYLAQNKQKGLRKAVENGTIDVTLFKKK